MNYVLCYVLGALATSSLASRDSLFATSSRFSWASQSTCDNQSKLNQFKLIFAF